jgi:protein O-GlcNAc transferase
MLIKYFFTFLLIASGDSYNWSDLDLPIEHIIYFFTNNPSIHKQCLIDKTQCPYYEQAQNLPPSNIACWGYEKNCKNNASLIQCPDDSRGWTASKEKQIEEFWRTADFGYIAEKRNELREFCSPSPSSSLECVDHLRFCRGKNLYIDFRHTETSKHTDRYREDILKPGDIGGNCKLNREDLIKNGDHKSPLQSWFSELQVFNETESFSCDLTISKPTIVIKLDSGYNMYHHFCDFINLYISQHMNNTFTKDIQIILWDTSQNDYWSFFSSTWNAFSSNRLIHIKEFEGKRVCFQNIIFSFLARMFYGKKKKKFFFENRLICFNQRILLQHATYSGLYTNKFISFI